MAEIKTTLIFDTDKQSFRTVENQSEKLGERSGKRASDGFSESFRRNGTSGIKNAFAGISKVALAAAAALGTALAGREIIQASIRQQDAINSLNASLARIGEFSQATSQDLQNFASGLQAISRVGDEVILQQLAIAQSFGATAEQSKDLTAAALDLAAAQGRSLDESVRQISKTLGGYAGELGEVIPELKNLTQEQLQQGAAIDLIAEKYRGFAAREAQTFSGAFERLSNVFGDFLEQVGNIFTGSDLAVQAINGLTGVFQNLGRLINDNSAQIRSFITGALTGLGTAYTLLFNVVTQTYDALTNNSVFSGLVQLFSQVSQFLQQNFIPIIGFIGTAFETVFNAAIVGFNTLVGTFVQGLSLINQGLAAIGVDTGFQETLDNILTEAGNNVFEFGQRTRDSFNNLFNAEAINQSGQEAVAAIQNVNSQVAAVVDNNASAQFGTQIATNLEKTSKKAKEFTVDINGTLNKGLTSIIQAGASSVGQALAGADASFESFGKSILGVIGDLLIQLGSSFIAIGLGVEAIKASVVTLAAGPALAAGLALTILGSALKSFSSDASATLGGVGTSGGGAGGGGGVIVDTPAVAEPVETEEETRSVNITINGDVLDSRESSLRIVELINQATENEGAIITGIT